MFLSRVVYKECKAAR